VTGHSFTGRYLMLDVTYNGGCAEHSFDVWWSGAIATSMPPLVPLELHHYDGGDTCETTVTDQLVIDCSALDGIAGTTIPDEPDAVRIDLIGAWPSQGPLVPELRYEVPTTELPPPTGATVIPIEQECGGITG